MALSEQPLVVTDETFEQTVLSAPEPVAVLFCTPKFGKCQSMSERWRALATRYAGRLRLAQLEVDNNRRWARKYGISALPATIWLRGGSVQQQVVGLLEMAELEERADALLTDRKPNVPERTAPALSSRNGPVVLTDQSFSAAIRDERPVLVDFWASWCGPCRMVGPVVDALAREMGERALVAKLNVDENPRTAQQFNVMSIPTLLIFRGNRLVDTIVGAQPAHVLRQRLLTQVEGASRS